MLFNFLSKNGLLKKPQKQHFLTCTFTFFLFFIFSTKLSFASEIAVVTLAAGSKYQNAVALGIENKRLYCERYGYDFFCADSVLDQNRPIPWSKIVLLQSIMENSNYKWIFWTDADSLIMNFDDRLEDLIDDNYNFILTRDLNGLNTGQFFIKNCEWSYNFLNKVYSHTECIHHCWWEQQAIILELKNNSELMKLTKILPQRMFNSYPTEVIGSISNSTFQEGDFIIHFASVHDLTKLRLLFEKYSEKVIDTKGLINSIKAPIPAIPATEQKNN